MGIYNYKMSIITNIQKNDYECSFVLNNVDKSLVNALRRTIMSEIPTIKFRTEPIEQNDVIIKKNTCALHNEFITHRIGMIPINIQNIEEFDSSKYTFTINVKNDTNIMRNVTTEDFKVYFDEESGEKKEIDASKFFEPDPITGEYILITQLKPDQFGKSEGETLEIEAKTSIGTGRENAGYSPVSKAVFYNTMDQEKINLEIKKIIQDKETKSGKLNKMEKQKIEKQFNNMEAHRHFHTNNKGEPNKFNFEIESVGILNVNYIMNQAILLLEQNINYFNRIVYDENDDIEITESDTVMDGIDILVKNQSHTLGNLIQSYLFINYVEEQEKLKFVGYKIIHPLENNLIIRIQTTEDGDFKVKKQIVKDIIQENTEKLNLILKTIRKEWNSYK